jgi:hypothetical protein
MISSRSVDVPQTVNVSLDCRNFRSNTSDYTNVKGSNNKWYSYKYTGGTDSKGNVTVKKGTPTDILVTIHADARYDVNDTNVTNDPKGDISRSHAEKTATFSDNARDEETDIYYQVTVVDNVANATFLADPKIDNVR